MKARGICEVSDLEGKGDEFRSRVYGGGERVNALKGGRSVAAQDLSAPLAASVLTINLSQKLCHDLIPWALHLRSLIIDIGI